MVQDGARWCNMVQDGVRWCKMVQDGLRWFEMVQYHAIPCNTVQYHAIPYNTLQYHAIPWNTMQYYAIQCKTMQYHASLITADGAYHCPVGSIMAIFCLDSAGHIFSQMPRPLTTINVAHLNFLFLQRNSFCVRIFQYL